MGKHNGKLKKLLKKEGRGKAFFMYAEDEASSTSSMDQNCSSGSVHQAGGKISNGKDR